MCIGTRVHKRCKDVRKKIAELGFEPGTENGLIESTLLNAQFVHDGIWLSREEDLFYHFDILKYLVLEGADECIHKSVNVVVAWWLHQDEEIFHLTFIIVFALEQVNFHNSTGHQAIKILWIWDYPKLIVLPYQCLVCTMVSGRLNNGAWSFRR
jgi:hypothetical protein